LDSFFEYTSLRTKSECFPTITEDPETIAKYLMESTSWLSYKTEIEWTF